MATVVDTKASARSGLVIAVLVVLGLMGLVAVNFTNNPPTQYSAPTLPR